ncbi:hypothetical protein D5086_030864 [Populus alba]|uniref:Uncharacterized protein n=1 Tax=Populus alba TaxID=43335 RepID=A0ACC4APP3_POPAL
MISVPEDLIEREKIDSGKADSSLSALLRNECKFIHKLESMPLTAEGLLERFSEKMAVAKEAGQSSQTPSSPEDLVAKPKVLDQGLQKIESALKLSNPYAVPEAHKCYVIFSGPNAGVYREWSTVDPAPGVRVPRLITPAEILQPKISKGSNLWLIKLKMPACPVIPRTLSRFQKVRVQNPDDHEFIPIETFDHYYTLAESTCSDEQNHFFISETKGFRLYNVTIGAEPKFVQTLYYCGLLNAAYPSSNLKEISLLPPKVLTAVKHYRQKVRINYQSDHVLMATDSLQIISPEDCQRIERFEKQFYCNDLAISVATKRKFCSYASEDHKCDFCPEDDKMETCSSNSGENSEDSCQPGKRRQADDM